MRKFGRGRLIGCLLVVALAVLGAAFAWRAHPTQAAVLGNLAAYWKLDESSGTTASDASGNAKTATLAGTQNWTAGKYNNGFSFSGASSNYMSTSLTWPSTSGSMATWARPGAINDWAGPSGWKLTGATNGYVLFDMGSGSHPWRAVFRPNLSGSSEATVSAGTTASVGTWAHLAMTWSLSGGAYTINFYVNGVSQGITTWTGSPGAGGLGNFRIGNTGDYNDNHFNGLVDETRVYSRALSSTEVTALYNNNRTAATWTGGSNADWTNASNWNVGAVPDNHTDITIGSGTNRAKLQQATDVANLTISSGGILDLAGNNLTLTAGSSVTNNGTVISKNTETVPTIDSSGGTVMYTNTSAATGLRLGNSYNNLIINSSLNAYWPMDDTSAGTSTDSSGYGMNGTAAGSGGAQNLPQPSTLVPTTNFANSRSLSFDGTDDIVTVPNPFTSDDFTISAWINPAAINTASYQGFLGRETGSGGWTYRAPGLWVGPSNGSLHFDSYDTSGTRYTDVLDNFFTSAAQWVHVTWVKSGATYTIYRNGTSFASRTAPVLPYRGGSDYTLGGVNNFLNGKLDDVRVYSRALSGSEVSSLATGDEPGITSGTTTLNSALTVSGNLTLNSGTLDVSTSNYAVNVAGNWINHGGVLTPRSGTVTLNGTNQAFNSSNTFNNLTKTVTAARTLSFAPRSTTTVSGTATFTGASGQLLSLVSSTPGTQWKFSPGTTVSASYVSITDSNNIGSSAVGATNSTNGGNNTNWGFNAPTTPSSLGPSTTTDGAYHNVNTPTLNFTLSDPDGSDTLRYRVQIDDSSDFSSPVTDYTSALAAAGARSFIVGQAAGSGSYAAGSGSQAYAVGQYYWRVMAIDNSSLSSAWAVANSGGVAFGVDTSAPTVPGTPSTTSPTASNTPTWTWTASTDTGSGLASPAYTVEWSQSSSFASGVSSATATTNSYTHTVALADGTWYFRVRATDGVGTLSSDSTIASVYINTLSLTGSSTAGHEPGTTLTITDLQISGNGNPTVPVKLRVTSGTLSFGSTTGLTFTGGSSGSTLYFSGTLANVNAALSTLRYNRASTGTDTLEVSLVQSGEVFFEGNGHLYEYVTSTQTWTNAKTLAEARSKYGATGYLATVTSSSENTFIAARLSGAGWMGAGDMTTEGTWKWVTGPEAGTTFRNGNYPTGTVASGMYENWNSGEPNQSGDEDCGQYLSGSGLWNDLPCTGTTLTGYVVEYGAPGNLPLVPAKSISITTNDVTAPTTPGSFTLTGSTPTADNTPTWTWTASTDGGSGLASPAYTVQWSLSSSFSSGVSSATTNSLTYTTTGLADGLWYFRVRAADQQSNTSAWATGSVRVDTSAPTTPGTPTAPTPTNDSTPTLTWTASTDAGAGLANPAYSVQWSQSSTFSSGVSSSTATTNSFTPVSTLTDGTWYFRVRATDSLGTASSYSSTGTVVIDTALPVISNIATPTRGDTTAAVTWTTDKATSSQVNYGPDSSGYDGQTTLADTSPRVTSHSVNLTNLVACAKYYFQVASVDASGNSVNGTAAYLFTTGCAGGATFTDQVDAAAPAASGGSLSLMSGGTGVQVTAPSAFTGTDVSLQIKQLDATTALGGIGKPNSTTLPVGDYVYDIKALLDEHTAVTTFSKAITVHLQYTDADVTGLIESSLKLWRWDDGTGWTMLDACSVNESANTITCTTTHFSTFALFGSAVGVTPSTATTNTSTTATAPSSTKTIAQAKPTGTSPAAVSTTPAPDSQAQSTAPTIATSQPTTASDTAGQRLKPGTPWWKHWWVWLLVFGLFLWFLLIAWRRRRKRDDGTR